MILPSNPVAHPCPELSEEQLCADCNVSEWSSWSACSNLTKMRSRTITAARSGPGKVCPHLNETSECDYSRDICYGTCPLQSGAKVGVTTVHPLGRWPVGHPLLADGGPCAGTTVAGDVIDCDGCDSAQKNAGIEQFFNYARLENGTGP